MLDIIDQYLKEVYEIPLLTNEDEIDLLRKIKLKKDAEAKIRFIKSNLRLVISTARKYTLINSGEIFNSELFLELIEEGNIGLIEAVNRFDINKINPDNNKPHRFSTYARWWIRKYISLFIKSKRKIRSLKIARLESCDDGGNFKDNEIESHETDPLEKTMEVETFRNLYLALKKLTSKEEMVLVKRYGLYGQKPMTLEEIARKLLSGVSKQWVRQIETDTLLKLSFKLKELLIRRLVEAVFISPP